MSANKAAISSSRDKVATKHAEMRMPSAQTQTRTPMTLAFSIFLLVFIAELVQWIGQSVIFELVRPCFSECRFRSHESVSGIRALSTCFLLLNSLEATSAQT